ncbi:MAG: hypothetical protein AAF657_27505 [Acidobacteriota bacterium]
MSPEPIDRFEQRFEVWASRPPATPADEAVRRMLRRLPADPSPRHAVSWGRIAAAAAAVLAVVLATHLYLRQSAAPPVVQDTTVGVVEAPLLPDGVALIWLDAETPLYLTLKAPESSQGEPTS